MSDKCTNKIGHVFRNFQTGKNVVTKCKFCGATEGKAGDGEKKEKGKE